MLKRARFRPLGEVLRRESREPVLGTEKRPGVAYPDDVALVIFDLLVRLSTDGALFGLEERLDLAFDIAAHLVCNAARISTECPTSRRAKHERVDREEKRIRPFGIHGLVWEIA